MIRYAALLEYDGGCFSGWQRQQNAPSAQAALETAWRDLFGEDITVTGASRTDAGVHARGQVAMWDSRRELPGQNLRLALNSRLPAAMAVTEVRQVAESFHARYGARGKLYRYRLETGVARPALDRGQVVHAPGPVDDQLLNAALDSFVCERDVRAFMDQGSPTRRFVRRVVRARAERQGSRLTLEIAGDGFVYHMVRILVGTALLVARGRLSLERLDELVEQRQRVGLGPTMPAAGLCLERVYYTEPLFGEDGEEAFGALAEEDP